MSFLRVLALLASGAATGAASAQTTVPPAVSPPTAQPEAPAPLDCAPKAAIYQAGKSAKIWVVRQGILVLAENPLRPLTRDEAVVLDVVVNGRRATAFGPDLNHLRQGGSPASLEREGREPIRWSESGVAPAAIRVVAEDGRVLLGPMRFGGCEDAPVAKAVADKPVQAEKPARGARKPKAAAAGQDESSSGPAPARLPQGAIDGLSLPKSNR